MDELVGRHARDRGLVHADVVGDVLEDHGLEVLNALLEEVALTSHDRFGDLVDRLLAVVDRADQPHGRAELVLDVLLGDLVLVLLGGGQDVLVIRRDAQLGHPVFVQDDHELVGHLVHVDVRSDVLGVARVERSSGLGSNSRIRRVASMTFSSGMLKALAIELIVLALQITQVIAR